MGTEALKRWIARKILRLEYYVTVHGDCSTAHITINGEDPDVLNIEGSLTVEPDFIFDKTTVTMCQGHMMMLENETEKTTAHLEGECPCGGGHLRKDHYGQRADLTGKEPRCLNCGGGLSAVIGVHGREICRECKRIFVTDESAKGFDRENLWGYRPGTRGGETVGPVERILTKSENLSSNQGGKTSK